jgi:hypothetical protein
VIHKGISDSESLEGWSKQQLANTSFRLARMFNPSALALGAFLLTVVVLLMYRPFTRTEGGDSALYNYISQCILRGQTPYRDAIDIKGPVSTHLCAMAMQVGKWFGVRDVFAGRAWHVVLAGLLAAAIYVVGELYLRSRLAALIAFLVPLMSDRWIGWMVDGGQPKLPMMLFGMLTLMLIARDKPFWSGFCSMLACLSWQPGLLFTGVAYLMFSRYLTDWRDRRALKVLIGAAVPLSIVLCYFYSRGALGDLWTWTITYNYSVFGPEAKRPLGDALNHLWQVMHRINIVFVWLGIAGLLIYTVERIREKFRGRDAIRSPDLFRDALLIPPLVYFVFSLINFQGGPDLIPFIPFIAIFSGCTLAKTANRLRGRTASRLTLNVMVAGLPLVVILALVGVRAARYTPEDPDFQSQDRAVQGLSKLLGPDDKIYIHGTVEILVLLNKPNANPYVDLDWGKDLFLAAQGVRLIDQLEAQAPRLVAISRLLQVYTRSELEEWVAKHYDALPSSVYDAAYSRSNDPVYIRRQESRR